MPTEIGFFFCENCGYEVKDGVPYEQKPDGDCPRCKMKSWIFEPTGEVEQSLKDTVKVQSVDHKAILNLVIGTDEHLNPYYFKEMLEETPELQTWLRQLLDENQNKDAIIEHLRQEVDIHAKELSKAVDENQALQDRKETVLKSHYHLESVIEAQAKEIEQLKIERDNLKASIEGCKGIEDYYRIQCRLRECLADKAAAVETLKWYADEHIYREHRHDWGERAHAILQRINASE